ncbi:MAG TPA: response regulator transcription factor, partial [Bryobacteraceae bacterium]|nr:response regulator transcription factor [Bryobacteraceae bacterium]
VRDHQWDLLLLDITMPGRSGLDILAEVRKTRPRLPVLVLSMHAEDQYGSRVLKAGASGYMTKESAPDELIQAIQRILSGGRYVSQSMAERLVMDLGRDSDRPPQEKLSSREFEVLRMIGGGKTVGQIAEDLHLSPTTVSTYRTRLLEKLGVTSTAELMNFAIRNNLVG